MWHHHFLDPGALLSHFVTYLRCPCPLTVWRNLWTAPFGKRWFKGFNKEKLTKITFSSGLMTISPKLLNLKIWNFVAVTLECSLISVHRNRNIRHHLYNNLSQTYNIFINGNFPKEKSKFLFSCFDIIQKFNLTSDTSSHNKKMADISLIN